MLFWLPFCCGCGSRAEWRSKLQSLAGPVIGQLISDDQCDHDHDGLVVIGCVRGACFSKRKHGCLTRRCATLGKLAAEFARVVDARRTALSRGQVPIRPGPACDRCPTLGRVGAALGYSGISLWQGNGAVYCEIACVVLLLVTLGRWLESLGKIRATAAIDSLAALLPTTVRRLDPVIDVTTLGSLHETSFTLIPLVDIQPGDRLWIKAGERIPVDAQSSPGALRSTNS